MGKGTKLYEALNGISQVYGGYDPFAGVVEGYYQGWLYFYEKPYNYYIGQGETVSTMQTIDYVSENTEINDDMDVYVLMDKPLGVAPKASIEAPLCGVETATGQKNRARAVEWDWDSQTNGPAVTADGEHYQTEGYWVDDQTGENPYIGPFVGDETCYAFISLEADLGYYFDKNIEEVNGSEQLVNAENYKTSIDAVATIKAVHDWDEPEYEWADDNSTVTARRVCKGDESHTETETVNTTSRIIKEATEDETGIKSYKAVFTNPAFTEQTKNVDIPKIDGHGGKTGTYRVPKTGVENVLDMTINMIKTQSGSTGGK